MVDLAQAMSERRQHSSEPDESAQPFVDAARRAMGRFGWSRTTMRDIAKEVGVERTTVYRHVGSIADLQRLVIADELQTLVRLVPGWIPPDASGADVVVEIVARSVEYCLGHELLSKVREDEPELLAGLLVGAVPEVIARLCDVFAPPVEAGMALGLLADRDPEVIVEWCVRIGLSLLVARPPGDLRVFLGTVLHPALDPVSVLSTPEEA
jgi:AcrR family transcriptional regulator